VSKILHIGGNDKFLYPFAGFIKENLDFSEHEFLIPTPKNEKQTTEYKNISSYERRVFARLAYYSTAAIKMQKADKIILHGLFDNKMVFILFLQPWLLKKCYWVMWGGDFYFPEKQSWIKNR